MVEQFSTFEGGIHALDVMSSYLLEHYVCGQPWNQSGGAQKCPLPLTSGSLFQLMEVDVISSLLQ